MCRPWWYTRLIYYADQHTVNRVRKANRLPIDTEIDGMKTLMKTHTDFGWLTFLLQSKTNKPSLEICDKSGHWRGVHPQADSIIVNFGDMMSTWSEGKVWAREHRVIAGDPDEAR